MLEEAGGQTLMGRPIDRVVFDEGGKACGVVSEGVEVKADCVIADASYVPEKVAPSHQVVRLYALLAHPPHKCKEAMSCQLIIPAEACGRKSDVYLFAGSPNLNPNPTLTLTLPLTLTLTLTLTLCCVPPACAAARHAVR